MTRDMEDLTLAHGGPSSLRRILDKLYDRPIICTGIGEHLQQKRHPHEASWR